MNLRTNEPINKTVMTYLTPLTTKITEYSTIKKYLDYMKKLTNFLFFIFGFFLLEEYTRP